MFVETPPKTQRCSCCERTLDASCFWSDRQRLCGLGCFCKECAKHAARERNRRKGSRPGTHGRKPIPVPEGHRWCGACRSALPVERFPNPGPRRQAGRCRECGKFYAIMRTYGLSREGYSSLLDSQGGKCAICKRRDPKYVDHCHATGRVRGILCQPCNTALGAFFEDAEIFRRAADYVTAIARNE